MRKTKYNLSRLISRYSHGTLVVESEAVRNPDGSISVPEKTESFKQGEFAVVPLNQDTLNFGGGGVYSIDDRKLHCYKRLNKGQYVQHTNAHGECKRYRVMSQSDYSDFERASGDGLHSYILKRSGKD